MIAGSVIPFAAKSLSFLLLLLNLFLFLGDFLIQAVNKLVDAGMDIKGIFFNVRADSPAETGCSLDFKILACFFCKNDDEVYDHVVRVLEPLEFGVQVYIAGFAKIEMHRADVDVHAYLLISPGTRSRVLSGSGATALLATPDSGKSLFKRGMPNLAALAERQPLSFNIWPLYPRVIISGFLPVLSPER